MKTDPRFPNLYIVDHPLIQHKLSTMRQKGTPSNTFRQLLREISYLLGYEVTRDLPLETREIELLCANARRITFRVKNLLSFQFSEPDLA